MSKCTIHIDFNTTADQLVSQAQAAIINAGGQFSGDTGSGDFGISTPLGSVKGTYTIVGQQIIILITDKPFLVSCNKIETELRRYLQ